MVDETTGRKKWEVIDLHTPMWNYLQAHRKTDLQFGMDAFALANDGVHPGEAGHWLMARQILAYVGFSQALKLPGITAAYDSIANGKDIIRLIIQRQELLRDAWLSETKHLRPGLPAGLPLVQAKDSATVLTRKIRILFNTRELL